MQNKVSRRFRSKNSLLGEITKLRNEIMNLTDRLLLIVNWISTVHNESDFPDDVAKALRQCLKIPENLLGTEEVTGDCGDAKNEHLVSSDKVLSDIGKTELVNEESKSLSPPEKEFICNICNKKLKNLLVLRAHKKEHLPAEVLVPLPSAKNSSIGTHIKPRHAYRCLVCQIVLTDRRKYLAHVSKHRRAEKLRSRSIKGPTFPKNVVQQPNGKEGSAFVKLQDLKSLKYNVLSNLGIQHGISSVISIFEQLHYHPPITVISSANLLEDEEEMSFAFESEDNESCDILPTDPLGDKDNRSDAEVNSEEYEKPTVPSPSNDLEDDIVKQEFKEEAVLIEESDTHEENSVPIDVLLDSQNEKEAEHSVFVSNNGNTVTRMLNRRKAGHTFIRENDGLEFGEKVPVAKFVLTKKNTPTDAHNGRETSLGIPESSNTSTPSPLDDSNIRNEDKSRELTCKICNKKLKNKEVLKSHLREHLPPEVILPWNPNVEDCETEYPRKRQRHRYRCLICKDILTNRRLYLRHVNGHSKKSIVTSSNPQTATSVTENNGDLTENSKSGISECDICHKKMSRGYIKKHKREKHLPPEIILPWKEGGSLRYDMERPRNRYRCTICDAILTDKRRYFAHVDSHSTEAIPGEKESKSTSNSKRQLPTTTANKDEQESSMKMAKQYNCDICNNKSNSILALRVHKREQHMDSKNFVPYYPTFGMWVDADHKAIRQKYKCPICEVVMTGKRRYLAHLDRHNKGIVDPKKDFPQQYQTWKCRFCQKSFASSRYLQVHERNHEISAAGDSENQATQKASFVCKECGKPYASSSGLSLHILKHRGKRPFMCFQCGKCFFLRSHLFDHERIHSENRPFKCDYCEKSFKSRQSKYLHERKHKESCRVICNLCGFGFKGNANLKKHIEGVHENKRPNPCSLCEKRFKTKSALKYHMQTHSNPNSKKRGLNHDIDPLKAAAKRRQKEIPNTVPITSI